MGLKWFVNQNINISQPLINPKKPVKFISTSLFFQRFIVIGLFNQHH